MGTGFTTGFQATTRRTFLKGATAAAGAGAIGLSFPGRAARAQTKELTMLAWYGHAEPDVVAAFEEQHGVKIKAKYYAGGDAMMGLISQSPPGTYDLILSDAEYVTQLNAAGYVEKLDPADYPFDDFYPEFQSFPGHWSDGDLYSVLVRFGFLGVSYNTQAITEKEARSYKVFWDPKLTGKLGHFDWHLPNLGQISLYDGNIQPYDIGEAQWEKLQETTLSLRPQVGGFFDYGGTFSSLENGEMLAMCGIGDWITGVLEKNGAPVRTVIPEEGGLQWTESFCIGKGSQNQELAKEFIQYITSPEGQVRSAMMQAYPALIPNKHGWELLNKEHLEEAKRSGMVLGQHNAMDDIREGRIKYRMLPVQQDLAAWNDFWSEYKNS